MVANCSNSFHSVPLSHHDFLSDLGIDDITVTILLHLIPVAAMATTGLSTLTFEKKRESFFMGFFPFFFSCSSLNPS